MSKETHKKASLTKGSAKEFAERLYSATPSRVSYTRLCEGDLKDGKLHCVIGEAYHTFVDPSLKKVMRVSSDKESKYLADDQGGSTGAAIDALVDSAAIKKGVSKERLATALKQCVRANDDTYEEVERAEAAAQTWLKQVVPLLK